MVREVCCRAMTATTRYVSLPDSFPESHSFLLRLFLLQQMLFQLLPQMRGNPLRLFRLKFVVDVGLRSLGAQLAVFMQLLVEDEAAVSDSPDPGPHFHVPAVIDLVEVIDVDVDHHQFPTFKGQVRHEHFEDLLPTGLKPDRHRRIVDVTCSVGFRNARLNDGSEQGTHTPRFYVSAPAPLPFRDICRRSGGSISRCETADKLRTEEGGTRFSASTPCLCFVARRKIGPLVLCQ